MSMPTIAALQPGRYFKYGGHWYKLRDVAVFRDNGWIAPVIDRNGNSTYIWLYPPYTITVAEEGRIPPTFQPASVRRRLVHAEEQIARLRAVYSTLTQLYLDQRTEHQANRDRQS